jgi:hypothetical protein
MLLKSTRQGLLSVYTLRVTLDLHGKGYFTYTNYYFYGGAGPRTKIETL